MADIENQIAMRESMARIFSLLKTISVETKSPLFKSHSKVVQGKGIHLLIGYVQALFSENHERPGTISGR